VSTIILHSGAGHAHPALVPTFGDRLKAVRERKGWSQEAVAAAYGAKGNARISEWEKRITAPRPKTIAKLARALETTVDDLTLDVPTDADLARELSMDESGSRIAE
jgi:transcriptional regulator with XRE-family HTH domain